MVGMRLGGNMLYDRLQCKGGGGGGGSTYVHNDLCT